MRIDFHSLPQTIKPHFQGGDKELIDRSFADEHNRILRGTLVPGASIGVHTHETGSEILYVIAGRARCVCDGKEEHLSAGDAHYCPKGHAHSLQNDGDTDLVFFAAVVQQ